jgi:uncharacterized C2H2 Zn-finger protein
MPKTIICDVCKQEFILNAVDIKKSNITMNGENLVLTHFECPHCTQLFRVSLDNQESANLIEYVKELNNTISKRVSKKQSVENLMKKHDGIIKRIRLIQHNLDVKYPGSFTINDNK